MNNKLIISSIMGSDAIAVISEDTPHHTDTMGHYLDGMEFEKGRKVAVFFESLLHDATANARLMIAAPELLESAKIALAFFDDPESASGKMQIAQTLCAAIAKAEGKEYSLEEWERWPERDAERERQEIIEDKENKIF